MLYLCRLSK